MQKIMDWRNFFSSLKEENPRPKVLCSLKMWLLSTCWKIFTQLGEKSHFHEQDERSLATTIFFTSPRSVTEQRREKKNRWGGRASNPGYCMEIMSFLGLIPVGGDGNSSSKHPAGLEIAYPPSWQQMPDLDGASSPNEYFSVSQTYRVAAGRWWQDATRHSRG